MQRRTLRGLAAAAVVGIVAGGAIGAFTRLRSGPVGLGSGSGEPGLVAVGATEGGEGWITFYRGTEETPYAKTQVPWKAYDEGIGSAQPVPLHLRGGSSQQIAIALGQMPGQTGGLIVVLDGPENGCKPLAWRRVVLGHAMGSESLWIAGGDVDGDGKDELVVGSPQAEGEVVVLDDLDHGLAALATLRVPWGAYDDVCGETRPAVGDLDGDGKAEVVVGLGGFNGPGGWLAVFKGLKFSCWERYPQRDYCHNGGGTWPSIGDVDGSGRAKLLIGTDNGPKAGIVLVTDALGSKTVEWMEIPKEVGAETVEMRPLCAALDGTGRCQVIASLPERGEACAAALFDDATNQFAFLGWRRGQAPARLRAPTGPVAKDPGAEAREAALEALRQRRGEVEVSRGEDGLLHILEGNLTDPSTDSPVEIANAFLKENAAVWGIVDPTKDLALDKEHSELVPDECKIIEVSYQQTVSGVPLLEHYLSLHMSADRIVTYVAGEFDPIAAGFSLDTTPRVTREDAMAIVRREARAKLCADPEPRLVAWRGDGIVRLCWEMKAVSIAGAWGRDYVLDATTGCVLSAIDTAASEGSLEGIATTTLSARAGREWYINCGGGFSTGPNWLAAFYLDDLTRPAHILTKFTQADEVDNMYLVLGGTWSDDDPRCQLLSAAPPLMLDRLMYAAWSFPWTAHDDLRLQRRREATAALRNMGKVLDYWSRDAHLSLDNSAHWRSYDNHDGAILLNMTDDQGWIGNAAWIGEGAPGYGQFLIGELDTDGNQVTNTPMDVMAHEFGHSVVDGTGHSGWTAHPGEPRAMHEHVADAFGEFAEYREASESADLGRSTTEDGLWIFGEEWGQPDYVRDFRVSRFHPSAASSATPGWTIRLVYPDVQSLPWLENQDQGYCHDRAVLLDHWLYLWVHGGTENWADVNGRTQPPPQGMMGGDSRTSEENAIRIAECAYFRCLQTSVWRIPNITFSDFRRGMLRTLADLGLPVALNRAHQAFRAIWLPVPMDEGQGISSPVNHATLSGATVNLAWRTVEGASEYWISVGTSPGGSDIFNSSEGTSLSANLSGLPMDGRLIYVRFWCKRNGDWMCLDTSYTAANTGGGGSGGRTPGLTSPATGATLTGASATFTWSAATGATRYWLWVGTTSGGHELFNQDMGGQLTASVSGLPTSGGTVYVRLWYMSGGVWQAINTTYAASGSGGGGGAVPAITSPAPRSALTGANATFTWSAATGATQYWLWVGTTSGGHQVYDHDIGAALSANVSGLPNSGAPIYVRLWYFVGGAWRSVDTTYTASGGAGGGAIVAPALTGPSPGSTLTNDSAVFIWTRGNGISQYWLCVGRTAGGNDLYNRDQGNSTICLVWPLPTDRSRIYARLWYLAGGAWRSVDATYTAADTLPEITSPAPLSNLTSSTVTFTWRPGGGVTQYWLSVGSSFRATDYFTQNAGTNLSMNVSGLPTDGGYVYVTLWYVRAGAWDHVGARYTSSGAPTPPVFTAPSPAVISGSARFAWQSNGCYAYWLRLGTTPGGNDLLDQNLGDATSISVPSLPSDGRVVYARLSYLTAGTWYSMDTAFPSAPLGAPAISSPIPGSTLTSWWTSFRFVGGVLTNQYRISVGTTPGGEDLYRQSAQVYSGFPVSISGLPTDGSTIYVRIAFSISGHWQSYDVSYRAASNGDRPPEVATPAPGSALPASTTSFVWNSGAGVTGYKMYVGREPDVPDVINGEDEGTHTRVAVSGLPTSHLPMIAWIGYQLGSQWRSSPQWAYVQAHSDTGAPVITSPMPGSTLPPSNVRFDWSVGPGDIMNPYSATGDTMGEEFLIGSVPETAGWYYDGIIGGTTLTVPELPADGRLLYVQLRESNSEHMHDAWRSDVFEYMTTAGGPSADGRAVLRSPVPGSILTAPASGGGTPTTFAWNPVTQQQNPSGLPVRYRLTIGSYPGGSDIFAQDRNASHAGLSLDVSGLPSDGRRVYVRLWYRKGDSDWSQDCCLDFAYTASGGQEIPDLVVPAPGSALSSSTAGFAWSPSNRATQYRLQVGSTPGGRDYYDRLEGMYRVATVTGLPTDGSAVYVRLSTLVDGSWRSHDSTYTAFSAGAIPAASIWAWGNGHEGQLGNGGNADRSTPVAVRRPSGVTALAAGARHSLALQGDGTVWAWGCGFRCISRHAYNAGDHVGMLGVLPAADSAVPVQVTDLTGVAAIAAGKWHSLALKSDGTVWQWGNDYADGSGASDGCTRTPSQVSGLSGVRAIAAGSDFSIVLKGDGTVWTWAPAGYGSYWAGMPPSQVPGVSGVTRIAAGYDHALALKGDGTVWAWGSNLHGALGNNSDVDSSDSPVRVSGLTGVTAIAESSGHCLALKDDGTVWAWGDNLYGQLGNDSTQDSRVPVRAQDLTNVVAIAAGCYVSVALKSDGTVWAWGNNQYGQLGSGTGIPSLVPVQIPGLQGITGIAAGGWHLLAMRGD